MSFEEAILGSTLTIPLETTRTCPDCGGHPTRPVPCLDCEGGFVVRRPGQITIRQQCRQCEGTGERPGPGCTRCAGAGTVTTTRHVTIRLPAGIKDGRLVRIPLAGESRYVVVRVRPEPGFGVDGNDLTVTVPITLAEAALGATVPVPTMDGLPARIHIPPGTSHGRQFRVRGRGVPTDSDRGDLVVTVEIDVPTELTGAQRQALQAFAAATEPPPGRRPPTIR